MANSEDKTSMHPKTDGTLNAFNDKLAELIQKAKSETKVKGEEQKSAEKLNKLQEDAYNLAQLTVKKYLELGRGLDCEPINTDLVDRSVSSIGQNLQDTVESHVELQTQSEQVLASLNTAIASIKDAAAKLQILTKDACNLSSTAQLESSLFDIAGEILSNTKEIAADLSAENGAGEYSEFAFNAAVKTAGIQALIRIDSLGNTLGDVQAKFTTLKEDVDTNLTEAKSNLQNLENEYTATNIEDINKVNESAVARKHEDALVSIQSKIKTESRTTTISTWEDKVSSFIKDVRPKLTEDAGSEESESSSNENKDGAQEEPKNKKGPKKPGNSK